MPIMIIAVLVVLGLCLGSFVNALVWRLQKQQTTASKRSKGRKSKVGSRDYSIVRGRSMCPNCKHELAWYDLLPVVSWLMLKGKCRYCGHKIEDSPVVELATAMLFIWSYLSWPSLFLIPYSLFLFSMWLVFVTGFIALTVYDLKYMELPNRIVYPLIGLAGVQIVFRMISEGDTLEVLTQAAWGFLIVGGLFYALFQLSKGKWIGGGDVKLGFVIGPIVGGPLAALGVIFLASLMGTVISLPLLAAKSVKPTTRIPFGPFLMTATFFVYLYSEQLADWYLNNFL